MPDTAASSTTPDQEIRFAVVMYGGVSLAIYIHGVAQELLRLVHSTSDEDLDEVAQIYKELGQEVRARFVVDILSGTSAGGINAVFLAKALALGLPDLNQLRNTWVTVADMNELLNVGDPFQPKRSLLKSSWMYEQLLAAFDQMSQLAPQNFTSSDQIDLFVTNTDLNGIEVPIQLADMPVPEKIYKGCFHFRYDNVTLAPPGTAAGDLDAQLDQLMRNDFRSKYDPLLAFAARATSSFPIAFEPVKLKDIEPVLSRSYPDHPYASRKDTYRNFFTWVPVNSSTVFDLRELADGGYLDNKPFDHAISAMTFRADTLRHQRKLLYVDPFPEISGEIEDTPHFDFIQNILAAATTLPRYQTIRSEIERVNRSNNTQIRLRELQKRAISPSRSVASPDSRPTEKEQADVEKFTNFIESTSHPFDQTSVETLTREFGSIYVSFHTVRLIDTTDDVARILSGPNEFDPSRGMFLAIRYLVRVWRNATYDANGRDGKRFENEFLSNFDYAFRMRRTAHLLEWAQTNKPEFSPVLIRHLTRLTHTREKLCLQDELKNPVWSAILKLGMSWNNIQEILAPVLDSDRLHQAEITYQRYPQLKDVAAEIEAQWKLVFDRNREELAPLRNDPDLNHEYKAFDFLDMATLAFLEGSDVSEHTMTEIFRISPADGLKSNNLKAKLAGYQVGAFGAFLKQEWRENDILWGRLDASERIVSAVLNSTGDAALRLKYIARLRRAIVEQESKLRSTTALVPALAAPDLAEYLEKTYTIPAPPEPSESARQIADAADILGRMMEEDVGVKNAATARYRSAAAVAAKIIAVLAPGSLGRVFTTYWLQLIFLMAIALALLGSVLGDGHLVLIACIGVASVFSVDRLATVIAGCLKAGSLKGDPATYEKRLRMLNWLRWVVALALTVLVVIGLLYFGMALHDLAHRIHASWHNLVQS